MQTSASYNMWPDGNSSWFYIYEYNSLKHPKTSDLPMVVGCTIIKFKIETYGDMRHTQTFIYESFWYKPLGAVPLGPVGAVFSMLK